MKQKQGVKDDRQGSMQRMKADATALGIVDRIG